MSDLGPSRVRKLPAQGEDSMLPSPLGRRGSAGWRRAIRLGGAEESEGGTSLVRKTLRCAGLEPGCASGSFRALTSVWVFCLART